MSPGRARHGARWSGCLGVFLLLLASALPARADDCGACTFSGLPTSRDLRFGLFPGELVTDISFAGSWGERFTSADDGARLRDSGVWIENRWVALLGFNHSLGLELEVPLLGAFTSASRTPPIGDGPSAQASRSGVGDLWLSLRFARPVGAWTVLVTAGVSLPTGSASSSRASAITLEERAEVVTSSGSGTWDPLVKLALTRRLGPLELLVVGHGQVRFLGTDWEGPPEVRLFASVGVAQSLGYRWRYGLSADVLHSGAVPGVDGAVGRQTRLLGTGFLQVRVNTWSARLSAHLPLTRWGSATDASGTTAWEHPLRIQLGWVTAFDVGV